jgi:hypothetical protein
MTTKNKIMKISTGLAASLAVFGFIGAVQANPSPLTTGNEIIAQGGKVTVTFISMDAADTDLAFLAPDSSTIYLDNKTATLGETVDVLGTFPKGTVLTFGLFNQNTGETFYTGDGSVYPNPDGDVHAQVTYNYNSLSDETYVGFEDLSVADGSDWDYNDLEFYVTTLGTAGGNTGTVPDASSTLPLLGMSLAGLAAFARRFKK